MENDSFLYNNFFYINPTIKWIIITFPFGIWFITFSLNYFFYSKFFLICFLKFFFVKCSNSFFTVKITNNTCPRHSIFNLRNHLKFFWTIWKVAFCKIVSIFWQSYMTTNFKFRIFFNYFLYQGQHKCLTLHQQASFDCAMICIAVFIKNIM